MWRRMDHQSARERTTFEFNDGDGLLTLTFDPFDFSAASVGRLLSLNYWIAPTTFESTDRFQVQLTDGVSTVTVLDLSDNDLETESSADDGSANWRTLGYDIDSAGLDNSNLIVKILVDTNAGSENVFIDNVEFQDGTLGGQQQLVGTVTQVEFFVSTDGGLSYVSIGVDNNGADGFSIAYTPPSGGDYLFYSVATDDDGLVEMAPVLADAAAAVAAAPGTPGVQVPSLGWLAQLVAVLGALLLALGFRGRVVQPRG